MVGLDLQVQEVAEEDGLLAVRARAAEADHAAEAVAVRAALLAEVASLALGTRRRCARSGSIGGAELCGGVAHSGSGSAVWRRRNARWRHAAEQ